MKRLLLILPFILFSCSEEELPPPVEIEQYYIEHSEECREGSPAIEFEVSEDIYNSLEDAHDLWDCEEYHSIPNIDRSVWYDGYLSGMRIEITEQQ